jgi:hypothetical protein
VTSSVAMPRTSSTSFMRGTGFMKWMPMKRSGRSVDAARRVIEIDEVLEASIASGFSTGQSLEKMSRLTSSFSLAASMTRSQSARSSSVPAGGDARGRGIGVGGVQLAGAHRALHGLDHLRLAGLGVFQRNVVEHDIVAGDRADLRDAAAHLSGADHAECPDASRHFFLAV